MAGAQFYKGTLRRALLALAMAAGAGLAAAQTLPVPTAETPAPVSVTPPKASPVPSAKPAAAAKQVSARVDKPLWKDLSPPQQVALDPLKGEWDHMEGVRKQKWLDIANRYSSMNPDEQQRIQEKMRAWIKLTPEQRRVARENYTLSKKIDKSQKSAQWEQYKQLPEEEKRKLAADAAAKKQVTNLPLKAQPKAVTPIKPNPAAQCTGGTVKNPKPAGPACIRPPPLLPGNPAVPVPNAK